MTNINLSITLNESNFLDQDSVQLYPGTSSYSIDMLLSPFYATEMDVMMVFGEEPGTYADKIRETIFNNSMKIDQLLTADRKKSLKLTDADAYILKRQFVICSSVYKFGDVFFKDYLQAIKKTKFLADFKVSLEMDKDPTLIKKLLGDARECMDEIMSMLEIGSGFATFSKGSLNPYNKTAGTREWWPSEGNSNPKVSIATSKAASFLRVYKIGANNDRYI